MKRIKMMALLLCAASIADLMVSCDSYERKMERLNKVASEFKATLSPNNQILAERIDSTAQKVFYLEPNEDGDGIKNINVHDYVTNETHSILPEGGSIEDFEFCDTGYGYVEYVESRLIKDRLFFKIWSGCMWRLGATGVFFVNIRDNSLHYIESCDDATFLENGEIEISKYYVLGENEYGGEETERKQYTLSTSLSDEAYADNRQEQKRIEERLAEEWREEQEEKRLAEERRRQGVERILNFDYSFIGGIRFEDYAGTLQGRRGNSVYTKTIVVPRGKVWQIKSIRYFGCSESNPPRFYGCMITGGAFDDGLKELKNGQVLDSWGYAFWMMFDKQPSDGEQITAEIVFIEKEIGY